MRVLRSALVATLLGLASIMSLGCDDATGPTTGAISVAVSTTGTDIDPDGYSLSVDGGPRQNVGVNAVMTIPVLPTGDHSVQLDGLAVNCSVSSTNPRPVEVIARDTVIAAFSVSCVAKSGNIQVSTTTSGPDVDPDGYTVSVDGGAGRAIPAQGTVSIAGLNEGQHTVMLSGVSTNCTVGAPNPLTVSVTFGATATAVFSVSCVQRIAVEFVALSAGALHTCALTSSGAVYCWGSSRYGQLGGSANNSSIPQIVDGGGTYETVEAGGYHTCGLAAGGAAYCWGANDYGQIGDETHLDQWAPVAVRGGLTFVALSAGGGRLGPGHTCGLTSSGSAYCWGGNSYGQLGVGTMDVSGAATPLPVAGGLAFVAIAAGAWHTCGLTRTGAAYCWGTNRYGQLGNATLLDSSTPVPVAGGLTFSAITAKAWHTCGLTRSGVAYCWGDNTTGELGASSTTETCEGYPCSTRPVAVAGGLTFTTIRAGDDVGDRAGEYTCGLAANGAAYCWGYNSNGQLGTGTTQEVSTPAAVAGGLAFVRLTAGAGHTCAVTAARVSYCWGWNSFGQLGNSSAADSNVPVRVAGQP